MAENSHTVMSVMLEHLVLHWDASLFHMQSSNVLQPWLVVVRNRHRVSHALLTESYWHSDCEVHSAWLIVLLGLTLMRSQAVAQRPESESHMQRESASQVASLG
jgi:hypothetical protein